MIDAQRSLVRRSGVEGEERQFRQTQTRMGFQSESNGRQTHAGTSRRTRTSITSTSGQARSRHLVLFFQERTHLQQRIEQERRELEQTHVRNVRDMQQRLAELEETSKVCLIDID